MGRALVSGKTSQLPLGAVSFGATSRSATSTKLTALGGENFYLRAFSGASRSRCIAPVLKSIVW